MVNQMVLPIECARELRDKARYRLKRSYYRRTLAEFKRRPTVKGKYASGGDWYYHCVPESRSAVLFLRYMAPWRYRMAGAISRHMLDQVLILSASVGNGHTRAAES